MPLARTILALPHRSRPASRAAVSLSVLGALLAPACHGSGPPTPASEPGTTHATPPAAAEPARPTAAGSANASGTATGGAHGSATSAASGATPGAANDPAATAAATAPAGVDFIADARLLYRVAACGGADSPLPDALSGGDASLAARLDKIVAHHCKAILSRMSEFRTTYFEKGRAWFDAVVPRDVPKTVVYPFGGGDLLSALVAFPDATEITTISLELAGDPRRLRTLAPDALERSLGALRSEIGGLISVGSNTSENLSHQQRNDLPGQVSSFLLGLVAGGYEPVAMRYFTLDDTGAVHYLDQAEIDELDHKARNGHARSLKHDWQSPNFSQAFSNVEIQYRKPGEDAIRVHRHIGWNLGDPYLAKHPEVIRHLESKGTVTMLTKGASYLLWRGDFSTIRTYMLDHMAWMLSDSTGIPPAFTRKAGMVQETYGHYTGAFLEGTDERHDDAFIELWRSQKTRRLPFRFGYVDKDKQAHLVITRPKG
ncbi:MAG TPA: hypothetical protein VHT91_11010 [Kofleriaceae bacterium]|nr:hypothetical protein [Kofleriaceae bacterium]